MNTDHTIHITWIGGEKVFKPIEYTVSEKIVGSWWWKRREYWIECEFSKLGPFDSKQEADRMLVYARM